MKEIIRKILKEDNIDRRAKLTHLFIQRIFEMEFDLTYVEEFEMKADDGNFEMREVSVKPDGIKFCEGITVAFPHIIEGNGKKLIISGYMLSAHVAEKLKPFGEYFGMDIGKCNYGRTRELYIEPPTPHYFIVDKEGNKHGNFYSAVEVCFGPFNRK